MKTSRLMIVPLLFVIILVFTPQHSMARFHTGEELVKEMREYEKVVNGSSDANLPDAIFFLAYIIGVRDATCFSYAAIPDEFDNGKIAIIVSKYFKNHPEKWHQPACYTIIQALQEAFPLEEPK